MKSFGIGAVAALGLLAGAPALAQEAASAGQTPPAPGAEAASAKDDAPAAPATPAAPAATAAPAAPAAAAPATPVPAVPAAPVQVTCLYDTVAADDPALVSKVLAAGLKGTTPAEEAIVKKINSGAPACRTTHSWTDAQQTLATTYLSGRAMRQAAIAEVAKYGITGANLDVVVAGLDAPMRQAYLTGNLTGPMLTDALRTLAENGATITGLPQAEVQALAQPVARALVGTIVAADAAQKYATGA